MRVIATSTTSMSPGLLRNKIQIQRRVSTPDGQGGYTDTWSTITNGTVWAAIRQVSGNEPYIADALRGVATHRATIRYLAGITTADTVLIGTDRYDILDVRNVDHRNYAIVLTLRLRQGIDDG